MVNECTIVFNVKFEFRQVKKDNLKNDACYVKFYKTVNELNPLTLCFNKDLKVSEKLNICYIKCSEWLSKYNINNSYFNLIPINYSNIILRLLFFLNLH